MQAAKVQEAYENGTELMVISGSNWETSRYGKRVRVLNPANTYYRWDRTAVAYVASSQLRGKKGVLVAVLDEDGAQLHTSVVPAAHLRGEYKAVKEQIRKKIEIRQTEAHAIAERRSAEEAERVRVYDALKARGVPLGYMRYDGTHTIDPAALLDYLEKRETTA